LNGFAWQAHEGNHLSDNLYSATLDFKKAIESGDFDSIDFGMRSSKREKENFKYTLEKTPTLPASPAIIPNGYFKIFSVDSFPATPFLYAPNYNDLATKMFGSVDTKTVEDKSNYWDVKEANTAIYLKANFKGDIAGFDYNANLGVRQVKISTDSAGYIPDLTTPLLDANGKVVHEWEAGPTWDAGPAIYPNKSLATASVDYNFTLPSASMNINLDDTKKLRLAIARAISRPPLDELKSGSFLSLQQGAASGDAGNPYLTPYTSDQVDVSYEWYFAKESMAAISVFHKSIDNYIGQSTIGSFVSPERPGHPQSTYTINGPINGKGGYVRGFELTFQMPFTFLPIDGFGIYSNYSHAESDIKEFTPANKPYPMAGLAAHSGVLDLWYSAHGFDARLGWKYTSAYTSAFTWNGGDLTTLDAETSLGFSLSYAFNEHVSSRLQLNNLTNQDARLTKFNTTGALARNDYYGRSALFDVTWKL
jgi:iron complex outermembrane receptor protein